MSGSLRLRLFAIILAPLLVISIGIGIWRVDEARDTAADLYDKSLLFTALAVSRDVALRDGDAISPETEKLLGATAGGPVRYHVYAPDGVFVTGYATPPVPVSSISSQNEAFAYFDAIDKGRAVRVLRLKYVTQIAEFSGSFTITVWQDADVREKFARALAIRAFASIAALIGTAAFLVWFGVHLGLKPLVELEEAVSRRNPEDLSPIQRAVPVETQGLVNRLNRLFAQVTNSMEAQAAFISDASHQLRNPIAGVRALGESILTAKTLKTAKERAADLVVAAARTGALAENLMTLERARAASHLAPVDRVDLNVMLADVVSATPCARAPVTFHRATTPQVVAADETMLREAVKNLIDNACVHGGETLTRIDVRLTGTPEHVTITVADDGDGVDPADFPTIRARFGQADPGQGSGLGLSITEAIAKRHGGRLALNAVARGFSATLILPRRRA